MNILYEDKYIIVLEKMPGISTQDDFTSKESMVSLVKEYLNKKNEKNICLGLINRLDKPVGGLIVFAKTYEANKILNKDISDRNFYKEYLAVTYGTFENKKGMFKDYIIKNSRLNYSKIVNKNTKFSKEAILEYELLKTIKEENKEKLNLNIDEKDTERLNLVKINLITGRHHQIRVQFASRNLCLLGDRKYNKNFKYNNKIKFIALWAYKLEFFHPIYKNKLSFILKPKDYPFNLKEFNI